MLRLQDIFVYSDAAPLIFSQYLFLFLFTFGYALFWVFHKNINLRNTYLLLFSLFFYYKSGGLYFGLLILSTFVDYWCGNGIYKADKQARKKLLLYVSLVVNLGLLAFFKYSGYFVGLINDAFGTELKAINFMAVFANGLFSSGFDIYDIVLPVGISFYTFQTLSYTIDIYRGELKPTRSIVDFGFFVTFFPQLVAGPIVRAADFIPQIYKKYKLTRAELGYALFLILGGLFKKTVISDYISINFVDRVFAAPEAYSGFSNLMGVYGYSIQIYCDFSGYSDMAIGLAALLGFKLPINFNSPYKATSITDFWRRWHISLSTWLRDYLYISLGGNRKGRIRTYVNLMLTMLLGGLWHGAATKFIIWGGLHGLALAIHKLWMKLFGKLATNTSRLYQLVAGLLTFHFVAFCWIYFRAADVQTVQVMLNQIFYAFDWKGILIRIEEFRTIFSILLLGFVLHFFPVKWKSWLRETFVDLPDWSKVLVTALVVFVCYQAKTADIQPFIYFQF